MRGQLAPKLLGHANPIRRRTAGADDGDAVVVLFDDGALRKQDERRIVDLRKQRGVALIVECDEIDAVFRHGADLPFDVDRFAIRRNALGEGFTDNRFKRGDGCAQDGAGRTKSSDQLDELSGAHAGHESQCEPLALFGIERHGETIPVRYCGCTRLKTLSAGRGLRTILR